MAGCPNALAAGVSARGRMTGREVDSFTSCAASLAQADPL